MVFPVTDRHEGGGGDLHQLRGLHPRDLPQEGEARGMQDQQPKSPPKNPPIIAQNSTKNSILVGLSSLC